MPISETRRDLYSYLDLQTREFDPSRLERFATQNIADAISVSRNLASQYLNDLVREGLVVKVGNRPVYYLHRHSLERYLQVRLDRASYDDVDEVLALRGDRPARDFELAVGHDLSLSSAIEQMRVAMEYPPCGMPVLVVGASGTGKTYLVRLMLEYGKNAGLLDASAQLTAVDCARYLLDPEKIVADYLGQDGKPGLIERAKGGLLLFKNIDVLPLSQQEYLFTHALFAARAEQDSPERGLRFVFSTSLPIDSPRAAQLRHRLPIVASLPALCERTPEERSQIALRFLKDEGRRMGVDVLVSKGAFSCLVNGAYQDNISELRRSITNACAEAYLMRGGDGRIVVRAYCLPAAVLAQAEASQVSADGALVDATRCSESFARRDILSFVAPMIERYEAFKGRAVETGKPLATNKDQVDEVHAAEKTDVESLRRGLAEDLCALEDHLSRGNGARGEKLEAFERLLGSGVTQVNDELGIGLSHATARLLAQLSYVQLKPEDGLRRWKVEKRRELAALLVLLSAEDAAMASLVGRLAALDFRLLGVELDPLGHLLLLLHVSMLEGEAARP